MEERLYEIQSFFVQHTQGKSYVIEFLGRGGKVTRLTFDDAEGIEFSAENSAEVKTAFLNLNDETQRIWNVRFAYPTHLRVSFSGKIVIEVR